MEKKNKRNIVIIILVILVVIVSIFLVILKFKGKDDKIQEEKGLDKQVNIVLVNNLNVEINSEVNLLSFINNKDDLNLVSEDELIDTSILGKKELVIKYIDNSKEKEYKFTININDTIMPNIACQKELKTTVGTKIDLLKDVTVTDNSKEEIKASVEGEYDFNKEGTYNLKYVAIDSSNNKREEEFNLIVEKSPSKSSSSSSKNNSNKNTTSTNDKSKDLDSMSDEEFLHLFDDLLEFAGTLNNEQSSSSNNNTNNSETENANNNSSNNSTTNKKDDYGHGPIVGSEILDVKTELASEKYGVKIYKEIHPYVNIYEDGYREEGSFSKTKVDFSGYNATTNDLRSEAESLVNKNWNIYEEHLKYVNAYREEKGVSPLVLDKTMSIAATVRALEMAYTNELSHTRPNGSTCYTIFDDFNLGGSWQGENIAAGDDTAKDVAESWRNSPGHYSNMINTKFTKIGIGMTYLQGTTYGYYWVQIFNN